MRKLILWSLLIGILALNACKKTTMQAPDAIQIAFSSDSLTLDQATTESVKAILTLSDTLRTAATVTVMFDKEASSGTMADIICDPVFTDGKAVLNLAPGHTQTSFTVRAANSTVNQQVIAFKVSSVTGDIAFSAADTKLKVAIIADKYAAPSITVSVHQLEDFGTVGHGLFSTVQSYHLNGSHLTDNITVVAPANFEVSVDNKEFKDSIEVDYHKANTAGGTVYVRFSPNSGKNIALAGTIRNYSPGATDRLIGVSGMESGNQELSLLLKDDFDYGPSNGNLTAFSSWINYSGTTKPIQYLPMGLKFAQYQEATKSGAISFENGSGSREDITRNFNETSTGAIYLAVLVNLSSASASDNGDFFVALRDASGGYFSRLYAKKNGAGKLLFGVAKTRSGSEPVLFDTQSFEFNKTYLVVVKYDLDKKSASLFMLDSAIPAIEPSAAVETNTGSDASSLVNIVIRQSSDAIAGTLDGVRVAKSWADLL